MRTVRALAATALALAASLAATLPGSPAVAVDTGTLSITLVDEYGNPMPGTIAVLGDAYGTRTVATSVLDVSVPAGVYAVLALTPWGGAQCKGMRPCDPLSFAGYGSTTPDGTLVVEPGYTTVVTVSGRTPARLVGRGRVGSPLVVRYSRDMQALVDYLRAFGGEDYLPVITWRRGRAPIAGATGAHYTPVRADVGKRVSARLQYAGAGYDAFSTMVGGPVGRRTTDAIRITGAP